MILHTFTNLCLYTYHVLYVDEHSRPTPWLLNTSTWGYGMPSSRKVTLPLPVESLLLVRINTAIVTIYKLQSARYITHYKKQNFVFTHA